MTGILRDLWHRRPSGAGKAALSAYRERSLGTRVHSTVRWWSAPFPAVEAALPATGRILEIGCGHGLFTTYVALASTQPREVRGVDIDVQKIADAADVADRLRRQGISPDLQFEVSASGTVPPGPWDAIVIVDMLYLLPTTAQRELLTAAAAELAPGGSLVVKEMSSTPRWKARWNVWQETLSVSLLGITERDTDAAGATDRSPDPAAEDPAAKDPAAEDPAAKGPVERAMPGRPRFTFIDTAVMAGWMRELGLTTSAQRLDRHRIHPHHLLIGRRAES